MSAASDGRSGELKRFLRAMRARLDPADAGLPVLDKRRRSPGLRIEEAAALADVGLTWYSALEAGKDIRVSSKLLERVAYALRLNPEEREHLAMLASPHREDELPAPAAEHVRAVIDGFTIGPAFVCDRVWNVGDCNALASAVYGHDRSSEKNLLVRMMIDPFFRDLHDDWEAIARQMIGILHLAYALAPDGPAAALVARLDARSAEFARWWRAYTIVDHAPKVAVLRHPSLGTLRLLMTSFVASSLTARKDRAMVLLQPPFDDETRAALQRATITPRIPTEL